ncbi:hypothetical protein HDV63DRAFT_16772 [Trichoderma sp. SZMC 28014]
MLVCITRVYRHFTYMLLAHVMQFALAGSLLRSGTALDSAHRSIVEHAKKKDIEPWTQASKSAVRCISALHSPRHAPLWLAFSHNRRIPFATDDKKRLPLAFCRDARHAVKEGLFTLSSTTETAPTATLTFVL